jgi:hypothetical protein
MVQSEKTGTDAISGFLEAPFQMAKIQQKVLKIISSQHNLNFQPMTLLQITDLKAW